VGETVYARKITAKDLFKLTPPIILCTSSPSFEGAIIDADYKPVSLNRQLASSIVGLDIKDIRLSIADKVREIFPKGDPVYLTDYEMLFDPRYEQDVLRLFVELSRRNRLIVKWCGQADGETLSYAQQGYTDYKQYRVSDYNIAIVI